MSPKGKPGVFGGAAGVLVGPLEGIEHAVRNSDPAAINAVLVIFMVPRCALTLPNSVIVRNSQFQFRPMG